MSCSISRKAFLLTLVAGSTVFFPSFAKASDSIQSNGVDRLVVEEDGDFIVIRDSLTGEWASFSGRLLVDGDELLLSHSSGATSVLSLRDGCVYLDGEFVLTAPVDMPTTRACVELSRKRFKVSAAGKTAVQVAASLAAAVGGPPYSIAIKVVMGLLKIGSMNSTEYVECISYYCDTPTPRMRYVTNFYTDSSYTKIKYSESGDSEFINP